MTASIDSTWLRCPNCFHDLDLVSDRTLGCEADHRFDLSRTGMVTLLPPRAPRTIGDDRAMLEARSSLLDSGIYAPIRSSVVRSAVDCAPHHGVRIADLGCGTGYYSAAVAERLDGSVLMADRSPDAVRMSTRRTARATGVVLDLWRPLPLRDGRADVALNVFAPRNPDEFARVLAPRGVLIVVVPRPDHLRELRGSGGLLTIPDGKAELVERRMTRAGLRAGSFERIEFTIEASREQLALIRAMGPSARHAEESGGDAAQSSTPLGAPTLSLTVAVDVSTFHRAA